ncbi:MAG: hypothetical protein AB7F88_02050 [Pyrinomonadaceae bacterium]
MALQLHDEIWQVEVGGQIYEASLTELPEWIGEGSLQPADKVRKGNLRWIEARKVPSLIPFFNAREKGEPMPVIQSVTDASAQSGPEVVEAAPSLAAPEPPAEPPIETPLAPVTVAQQPDHSRNAVPGQCVNHFDRPTAYICSTCEREFCKACPTSYGGNVRICPDCGSMCRSSAEAAQRERLAGLVSGIGSEPFGFADFGRAFSHPFKFKTSLIFGGLLFMFFSVGQAASSIGGITLIAASIICMMLANMLAFGIRANVIDNFTQGRLEADFMPSFDEFSLWDDVIHPFFLYIAAVISSFGPFILVAIIGAYLVVSAASEQMKKFNDELTSVPGTEFYAPDRTAEQSKEVQDLLGRIKQQNDDRVGEQQRLIESAETGDAPPENAANAKQEDLDELLQEIRSKRLEQAAPVTGQDSGAKYAAVISSILRLAAPLVVVGMLTFLWGAFYYPAACAVAGYTRSFAATINPMVGLDTIRRLGITYVKVLFMAFLILVAAAIVGGVLEAMLSPFDLPRAGNIPALVLGSFVTFYFSVVFSCILGYALFKSADRLKLCR